MAVQGKKAKEMESMTKKRLVIILVLGLGIVIVASTFAGYRQGQEQSEKTEQKYGLDDTCNRVAQGVRLILAYHRASFSFIGSVENVTDKNIKKVRVKVHLSNGTELGSIEPKNLEPGEKSGVKIEATEQVFEWWMAHVETESGPNCCSQD